MAAIRLHALGKTFPTGHAAIRDVDLSVGEGECLVLVGPSGCGKSTLLRIIAGLETADAGHVEIGGVDVTSLPPQARDVAMVFQGYALYPHLTVRENLAYGLKVRGVDAATRAQRVREVADSLGLAALLDRRPAQLSGGQRQRVALGRAIVRRPQVFLFDEPLSNLDPGLRVQARAELRRLHAALGVPFVYVTHDQEEAMTLADRVAVMHDGAIEQVGPPIEVYARPANLFVARFIGAPAMNLCPGGVAGVAADPDVTIGIRPHDVVLGDIPGEAGTHRATVDLVELRGPDSVVHLRLHAPGEPRLVAVVAGEAPRVGRELSVTLPPDRTHRFGGDGRRLAG